MTNTTASALEHPPTAPLPPAAEAALHRLDRAFSPQAGMSLNDRLTHEASTHVRVTPEIRRAVVRYGNLLARVAELQMRDRLTPAEFNSLADAQAELTALHELLEQAGQLHLVVA